MTNYTHSEEFTLLIQLTFLGGVGEGTLGFFASTFFFSFLTTYGKRGDSLSLRLSRKSRTQVHVASMAISPSSGSNSAIAGELA